VLGAFVVGSEAKETARSNSDLDIAVIIPPVMGKTALRYTEEYHSHFPNDETKPCWNGRRVDFQFFYPNALELETYQKIPLGA
jgi:predicted nucleotidyltransferase